MKRAELKTLLRKWVVSRLKRGDTRMEVQRQLWRMAFGYISYHPRKQHLCTAEELAKRLAKGLPSIDRKAARKAVNDSWERDDRRRLKGY